VDAFCLLGSAGSSSRQNLFIPLIFRIFGYIFKTGIMFIKQLYTGCLSEAAYYIESKGEAAVIDPLRDTQAYVSLAAERKAVIKYIFETHFHADFVSGHLDLAKKTGAPIVYGPGTRTRFPIHLASDGEVFPLGEVSLTVLHTPGHTVESTCYLLKDETGAPVCIFTGDTLFVGDVGRPDLSSGNLSKEDLASMLYDSMQKLKELPDEVIVYPAHGPGSSCGKSLGPGTSTTIGEQKQSNYALRIEDRQEFIGQVTTGLEAPPAYFSASARINQQGYEDLETVVERSARPLDVQAFKEAVQQGAWILDTRPPEQFTEGFVPASVNIGLKGRFAEWVGALVPFDQPVVLVTSAGEEQESIVRMARVGFDKVQGYLEGGMEAWRQAGEQSDMIVNVDTGELRLDMEYDPKLMIVDVRKSAEFAAERVKGAVNMPLEDMADVAVVARADEGRNMYVHCQSGYRSVIACSLLKRQGFHNLYNVSGGFASISETPGMRLVRQDAVLR
jgi:glyoxylase-like metal-dependent hydrolase (beta-lactamase superfamily II)/rhodanese-related sulfurtransferase